MSHFVIKCHNEPTMKPQPLLTPKTRFPCIWYHVHFIPNVFWFFILRGRVYFCPSLWTNSPERLGIYVWNLGPFNKTFSETFLHILQFEIRSICGFTKFKLLNGYLSWPMSSSKPCLTFFLTFLLLFVWMFKFLVSFIYYYLFFHISLFQLFTRKI